MEITVKMPVCIAPELLDVRVSVGTVVEIGDILFSYSADGALLFEYSAFSGVVTRICASRGEINCGDAVLRMTAEKPEGELFPQSRK